MYSNQSVGIVARKRGQGIGGWIRIWLSVWLIEAEKARENMSYFLSGQGAQGHGW